MDYAGKHALVLGLGESGLAMAQWLARCGAAVRVADTRQEPERLGALRESVPAAGFVGGELAASLLDSIDFVAVSPGLMPRRELADILPAAAERGIPVWSEIELFAQALAALKQARGYAPKVIAITGTNGKTTVTSMVGHMCRRAGLTVEVAGNISPAALDVLRRVVEEDKLPQAWTLELSSFQLTTTYSLNADAATVLNVTQDHLDWHDGMEEYAAAKARIFGPDTVRVLNRDDQRVMAMRSPSAACVTFGLDEPAESGCFGLHAERGLEAVVTLGQRWQRDAVRLVLADVPAGSHAEDEAASGHAIEHGGRLGRHGRMSKGIGRDGDADPLARDAPRQRSRCGERLERGTAALPAGIREVVAHPAGVEDVQLAGQRPRLVKALPVKADAAGCREPEADEPRPLRKLFHRHHRWTTAPTAPRSGLADGRTRHRRARRRGVRDR